ncbi:Uncharacterised protein [uncultured archaeon]|nr:Uncharacterised protein [uncultured archaeon]
MDFALIVFAAVTLAAGTLVFLARRQMTAVIFLAIAGAGSAALFVLAGEGAIALLQLLVFVGGLSTYLMVAVAADETQVKTVNRAWFFVAMAAMILGLLLATVGANSGTGSGNGFLASAEAALEGQYAFIYASVIMVFSAAMGSALVMNKLLRRVV